MSPLQVFGIGFFLGTLERHCGIWGGIYLFYGTGNHNAFALPDRSLLLCLIEISMPLARKEKIVSATADLPFHVVIPARLDSSRLPGKVLRGLGGIHLFYGTGNRNAFALPDRSLLRA